ncbi:MAG: hypothetical protein RR982_04615 [Kiritimatiellia bacterium]
MATDWNIQPRTAYCTNCHTAFLPGSTGHSLLLQEAHGFLRHDLCHSCFLALPKGAATSASAAWTFTVSPPSNVKSQEEIVHKETVEHLLRVLFERHDPADLSVIYILAILMERGKQLIERSLSVNAEGHRVRHYEHKKSGDLFAIIDPGLREEDIAIVQQRVMRLLEDGAPTSPPTPHVRRRSPNNHHGRIVRRKRFL